MMTGSLGARKRRRTEAFQYDRMIRKCKSLSEIPHTCPGIVPEQNAQALTGAKTDPSIPKDELVVAVEEEFDEEEVFIVSEDQASSVDETEPIIESDDPEKTSNSQLSRRSNSQQSQPDLVNVATQDFINDTASSETSPEIDGTFSDVSPVTQPESTDEKDVDLTDGCYHQYPRSDRDP